MTLLLSFIFLSFDPIFSEYFQQIIIVHMQKKTFVNNWTCYAADTFCLNKQILTDFIKLRSETEKF